MNETTRENESTRENMTTDHLRRDPASPPESQYSGRRRSDKPRSPRSLFWPIVLMSVGLFWLLFNLEVITAENLTVLVRLWPLFLIVLGLELLFGRRLPALGSLFELLIAAAVIYLVINGPALGLTTELPQFDQEIAARPDGVRSDRFVEPMNGAQTADIDLELGWQRTNIYPLEDSDNLVEAELDYAGEIEFNSYGDDDRHISISERDFNPNRFTFEVEDYEWNIGINPQPEVDLTIKMGVNEGNFDLSGIDLNNLNLEGGYRNVEMTLPAVGHRYEADIDVSFGDTALYIEEGAEVDMRLVGGIGDVSIEVGEDVDLALEIDPEISSITIIVPDDAAVRVETESTSGGELAVPEGYTHVEEVDEEDFFPFADSIGAWESPDYSHGDPAILITVDDLGYGDITIEN
ncbi:MAG: hypothetical protein JXJ17_13240 [Anaerolineae bacterium]|nr:hypothetical protein [Anaerolineae bacterium]